jgi:deazaflavin-dependent oxidoreductase (nitroreductase family)
MRTNRAIALHWVLGCALAEAIGMTAAAVAARLGNDLAEGSGSGRGLALGVVVAGGLVEGAALGVLQGQVLAARWPALPRLRYLLATVAVAGVGWAAASAPGVLAGDDGATAGPPLSLILLGALGIGLLMGPVLGAAQAAALRGVVRHPWRWAAAGAAAWPPAMAVIFLGASTAGAGWPTLAVAGYGAVTGGVAGTVLGAVSAGWLGSLDGQPVVNRLVLWMLARRWFGMDRTVVGLAVRGRRTGRVVRFPVQFAADGARLVVVPGRAAQKTWWRNLELDPAPVGVLDGTGWHPAAARVLDPESAENAAALAAYLRRWPRFRYAPDQPVVVLDRVWSGIGVRSAPLESVG